MARSPPPPKPRRRAPLRFNALPTYKLYVPSSLTSKHGELLYQRLVGLRTVECHILGVLAHFGPVALKQTCVEVGIDKGQGSHRWRNCWPPACSTSATTRPISAPCT